MEERRAFPSLERALIALAGMYVGLNGLSLLLSGLIRMLSARGIVISSVLLYACSAGVELLCVGLPAVLWARRGERHAVGAVRHDALEPDRAAAILLAAVTSVPLLNVLSALWCALLDAAGIAYSQGMAVPERMGEIIACLLTTAVVAPVCEEEFFRGRLFAALETLGTRRAIGLSTVFFALLHGNIGALPVHLCVGLILALLLVRRRSLTAALLFHAGYNGATVLLAVLPTAVLEVIAPWTGYAAVVGACALWYALRPCARMYVLPGGRRMSQLARAMTLTLLAAFALPYLFAVIL